MAQLKVSADVVSSPGHAITVDRNYLLNEKKYPIIIWARRGNSTIALMLSDQEVELLYNALHAYRILKNCK